MTTKPSAVEVGSEWLRRDPEGDRVVAFEVTKISLGPMGIDVATGRTTRGKVIKCQIRQMLTSDRFVFVSAARVREAG